MSDSNPSPLDLPVFLKNDKENMGNEKYTDDSGNAVRFHAANKEFYQIAQSGDWKVKSGESKRVAKHRWSSDATYQDRMCPVYVKADKGNRNENWFAEYIKLAQQQTAEGVKHNNGVEFFIAAYLGFTWGVQTLRTQISQHKDRLVKKGVSREQLDKIPSLKVYMPKPRPTFVKTGSKSAYTEEQVSQINALLMDL